MRVKIAKVKRKEEYRRVGREGRKEHIPIGEMVGECIGPSPSRNNPGQTGDDCWRSSISVMENRRRRRQRGGEGEGTVRLS